jgi:20S proteasome alpha/beta subunit
MTLLVGVLCTNGAVIAADRQAQHGNFAIQTVGQAATKIKPIADDMLYACSGPVGLGQQYAHILANEHVQLKNRTYHSATTLLQKKMREILDPAMVTAGHAAKIIGHGPAQADVLLGGLLAGIYKEGVTLTEISHQCGFEAMSTDLPFICIGSGKQNADPFMRFIWEVYFSGGQQPNVSEGSLVAYWTVKTVIDAKTSGVGYEPDVFVLEKVGKDFKSRQLSKQDMQAHDEFIGQACEAMRSIRDKMSGKSGAPGEDPPTLNK